MICVPTIRNPQQNCESPEGHKRSCEGLPDTGLESRYQDAATKLDQFSITAQDNKQPRPKKT
jgi:hypothetical protein